MVDGERQVPELNRNNQSKVVVNMQPGPISPAQKQAWRKLCQKLITEVKANER